MKITRISGKPLSGKCIAMTAIASDLQRSGKAVLECHGKATTAGILAMCTKPVPFAIMLNDFDPDLVDLDVLNAEPSLDKVLCYIEIDETKLAVLSVCPNCGTVFNPAADPDDKIDDVLPLRAVGDIPSLVRASDGIITAGAGRDVAPLELVIAADSEGGDHD